MQYQVVLLWRAISVTQLVGHKNYLVFFCSIWVWFQFCIHVYWCLDWVSIIASKLALPYGFNIFCLADFYKIFAFDDFDPYKLLE